MIKRFFDALTLAAVVFFVAVVILAAPSFFDPVVEVVNRTGAPVAFVASWRDRSVKVDALQPSASHRLRIDDEAAITFSVVYADGRQAVSEPLYFTAGIEVIATISDDGVEARYAHGQ